MHSGKNHSVMIVLMLKGEHGPFSTSSLSSRAAPGMQCEKHVVVADGAQLNADATSLDGVNDVRVEVRRRVR